MTSYSNQNMNFHIDTQKRIDQASCRNARKSATLRNTALKSIIVSKSPYVPPGKPKGRPFKAKKDKISKPYIPSGRPRGRPKKLIKNKANEEKIRTRKNLIAKINEKLSL